MSLPGPCSAPSMGHRVQRLNRIARGLTAAAPGAWLLSTEPKTRTYRVWDRVWDRGVGTLPWQHLVDLSKRN